MSIFNVIPMSYETLKPYSVFSQPEIQDQLEFLFFRCEIAHRKQIGFELNLSRNIKCVHTCEKNPRKCEQGLTHGPRLRIAVTKKAVGLFSLLENITWVQCDIADRPPSSKTPVVRFEQSIGPCTPTEGN